MQTQTPTSHGGCTPDRGGLSPGASATAGLVWPGVDMGPTTGGRAREPLWLDPLRVFPTLPYLVQKPLGSKQSP